MLKKYLQNGILIFLFAMMISFVLHLQNRNDNNDQKLPKAMEALNFWSYSRAYPGEAIPDVPTYAAYEYSKSNLIGNIDNSLAEDSWESIGPHNIGGRTLALAFNPQNPNTIFAGSASGGLWKSYSAGRGASAWEYVPTGFPVLGVSSITFAPNDSNTIYIGTGEVYSYQTVGTGAAIRLTRGSYGIGILKSTDGGETWTKSLDWSYQQQRGIWQIKVNPLNPNTVWAATTEGTYKSLDAGSTWAQVHNVIMANDLILNPIDTNIVVVGCGNFFSTGHGIYRTTDGGNSWVNKTVGLPSTFGGYVKLAMYESDPSLMFAGFGNGYFPNNPSNASWLCKSTDAGDTWAIINQQDYTQYQGWFAHDLAVNPTNPDEIMAIGVWLWKSTDGGASIVLKSTGSGYGGPVPPGDPEGTPTYSHADHHDVVYHPVDHNIIYYANDGGVNRSTDGGETFQACNGGYQTSQFYGGFSSSLSDSALCIGGLQDNGTTVYRGTTTWYRGVIGGDGGWTGIKTDNDTIMFGTWQGLNLMKSFNRGLTFFNFPVPGTAGPTAFIAPFVMGVDDPLVMYAGRDVIYKTTDEAFNWFATNNGNPVNGDGMLAMAISSQNSDIVYAATFPIFNQPQVFKTIDGGDSWLNITGSLPNRFPGDIFVDPNDDSIVYITFLGFGTGHVFRSTDGGNNWLDIGSDLPDVPTSSIVVDPSYPENIYVGNDLGIYVSVDNGNTWQEYMDGAPGAMMVIDLSISPSNRKLRAATHGNGIYERGFIEITTDVEDSEIVARNFNLEQNYPNPFNPTTTIKFTVPRHGGQANVETHGHASLQLKVFDILGKEVATLVNEQKPAGSYEVEFNATELTSGIYFYKLQVYPANGGAGKFVETKKMILLK